MKLENEKGLKYILYTSTKYKMFNFMISIMLLLILSSFVDRTTYGFIVLNVISSIVFIFGVYAVAKSRRSLIILLVLGVPWLVSEWFFTRSSETIFVGVLFFLYVTVTILDHILKTEEVTADTLYGAVCVYLLLGILWATVYLFIDYLTPEPLFMGSAVTSGESVYAKDLLYYSYTTLTTLGYGDITSVSPEARIISVLEAIIGQLYIAFLVARFVSIYTANAMRKGVS